MCFQADARGKLVTDGPGKVIMLMTTSPKDQIQEISQRKAMDILSGKGITVDSVDGTDPACKARRSALFAISGKGAVYPQFFLQLGDGEPTCVGDYEEFEGLVECDTMDAAVLAENPDIPTFSNGERKKTFCWALGESLMAWHASHSCDICGSLRCP